MPSQFEVEPYDPCPCGSGAKYKFCCAAKAKEMRHGKFPMGTVTYYGPDDKTVTKIAAGVILRDGGNPTMRRWTGENVQHDAKVAEEIKRFFAEKGVKTVVAADGIRGCPHEEGIDFPMGVDCPMCPFWAGKQGTVRGRQSGMDVWKDQTPDAGEDFAEEDVEDDWAEDDEDEDEVQRDYEAQISRVQSIIGSEETDFTDALPIVLAHLKANLSLPCEVKGSEDFDWEEPYVLGGWSPAEYKELKKIQPSYRDRFQLLSIGDDEESEWSMFDQDIIAHVRRISDGKEFFLGLAELQAIDRKSSNYQLIDDYGVWFVNAR